MIFRQLVTSQILPSCVDACGRYAAVACCALAVRLLCVPQHQNSNLSEEFGTLLKDIGPGLPWADDVFGGPPEATNLWIGDGRSVTSFHKGR